MTDARETLRLAVSFADKTGDRGPLLIVARELLAEPPPACGSWVTDGSEPRAIGSYLVYDDDRPRFPVLRVGWWEHFWRGVPSTWKPLAWSGPILMPEVKL